ncbi:CLUMA_CG020676, isoform A [Clunio marinus]|uniref:CLUMA_CG020676, isoform A n=1 Tax=Clunio marinus TaxID=568069 RepID=A0A1J1J6W3_9DIPT|nr:CLUMA_CG020676, isoform A [Clunio marinus]
MNSNIKKVFAAAQNDDSTCLICNEKHKIYSCSKLLAADPQQRYHMIKAAGCCVNCFGFKHQRKNCPSSSRCRKCQKDHHTLLHMERAPVLTSSHSSSHENISSTNNSHSTPQASSSSSSANDRYTAPTPPTVKIKETKQTMTAVTAHSNVRKTVLLSTVTFLVRAADSSWHLTRALFDSGSDTNFISFRLASLLKLNFIDVTYSVSGIEDQTVSIKHKVETVIKSNDLKFLKPVDCYILSKITDVLPSSRVAVDKQTIPNDKVLADPNFDLPLPIDMLVGADVFYEALLNETIRLPQGLIMTSTAFGWILGGLITTQLEEKIFSR